MVALTRTLADPTTYRRLAYVLLGIALGPIWFAALITGWSLCMGMIVTPMVIPLLFVVAYMTRGFAAVEAEIASSLLGVDARAPEWSLPATGFWDRLRSLFGADFWRAQTYLWLRWLVGFPVAVVFVSLLASAVVMALAPLWVPFVHQGVQLGFWHPHTFLESLALIPVGLVLLPLTLALASPVGAAFGPVAAGLLRGSDDVRGRRLPGGAAARSGSATAPALPGPRRTPAARRQALAMHAAAESAIAGVVIVIWAVTSLGYFWPIWLVLPMATTLGMHAWLVALTERPQLVRRFRGSRSLAATTGVGTALWLFTFAVWAITAQGYFWPIWTLLALAIVVGAQTAAVMLASPHNAEMAERIETLKTSRAGAVSVQDSELRRIERDLHDGAQARLVALGMSLGMAEQKLAEDPERAGQLLAEARVGAEQALRELRDLARGIHPPVLADRGLEAALSALANSTPMHVSLSVDVPQRPPSTVESAAYFVAAEALANAAKHARADWLDIRIARIGHRLEVEITDDGVGSANPQGSGLVGLRRRVEALDGRLEVTSPPGGPTTLYAELPCV